MFADLYQMSKMWNSPCLFKALFYNFKKYIIVALTKLADIHTLKYFQKNNTPLFV